MSTENPNLNNEAAAEPEKNAAESETLSYESMLGAIRVLQENVGTPEEEALRNIALEMETRWKRERGLETPGIFSVPKAEDAVKAATVWIEAGFQTEKATQHARESLYNWLAQAAENDSSQSVLDILQEAIDRLEHQPTPEEVELKEKIDRLTTEARTEMETGSKIRAVGRFYNLLYVQPYKDLVTGSLRQELGRRMNQCSFEKKLKQDPNFEQFT